MLNTQQLSIRSLAVQSNTLSPAALRLGLLSALGLLDKPAVFNIVLVIRCAMSSSVAVAMRQQESRCLRNPFP
jgi:hypothetical protein